MTNPMTDQYIKLSAAIAALNKVSLDFGITGIPQIMIATKDAILDLPTYPAAQVTVKPGEIERAVWSAMGWALLHAKQLPGDIIPAYIDSGNSDAEIECRRAAARILSALTVAPAPDLDAIRAAFREGIEAGVQEIVQLCDDHAARLPVLSNAARGAIGKLRRAKPTTRKEVMPNEERTYRYTSTFDTSPGVTAGAVVADMEPLGRDFEAVWDANAARLYEDDGAAPAGADVAALRVAYRLGFEASSEMWNGEFPFRGEPVEGNAAWVADRDRALASLGGGE